MDTIYEWSSSRPGRSNPLPRKEHGTHWIGNWMRTISGLLPIDQKMIRSRNTIDERAQYFVMNYEFLLPMLKAYTQWTGSLRGTRNAWCFQYVSSIGRTVCRSYQQQSTSTACSQQSPAPHHISPTPTGPSCGQWPVNAVGKNICLSLLLRPVGWSPFRATRIKDNAAAVAVVIMLLTPSSMNWPVTRFMNSSHVITLILLSTFRDLRNRNIRNRYLQHTYKQWHVVSA